MSPHSTSHSAGEQEQDDYKQLAMKYVTASGFGCNHYMLNKNAMNTTFEVLPVSQTHKHRRKQVYCKAQDSDLRSYIRQAFQFDKDIRYKCYQIIQFIKKRIRMKYPLFPQEIAEYLHKEQNLTPINFQNFQFLLERISTACFTGVMNVPLERSRRPGFKNSWLNEVPSDSREEVTKIVKEFKTVVFKNSANTRYSSNEKESNSTRSNFYSRWSPPPSQHGGIPNSSSSSKMCGNTNISKSSYSIHNSSGYKKKAKTNSGWGNTSKNITKNNCSQKWGANSGTNISSGWRTIDEKKSSTSHHSDSSNSGYVSESNSCYVLDRKGSPTKGSPSHSEGNTSHGNGGGYVSEDEEMNEKVEDTSKKSEVKVEITSPSYIERFHDQAKQCSNTFYENDLPKYYFEPNGNETHVCSARKKMCIQEAIEKTVQELREAKKEEMESYDDDDDDDSIEQYSDDYDDGTPYGKKENSTFMNEYDLKSKLTTILEDHLVWDIGLQMEVLKMNGTGGYFDQNVTKGFTSLTFCPCNKACKWLNDLDDPCKNTNFDHRSLLQHFQSKSSSGCYIHKGLFYYTQQLYNDVYKRSTKKNKKKKKVCELIITLPNPCNSYQNVDIFHVIR
jgi:hypothetical protein